MTFYWAYKGEREGAPTGGKNSVHKKNSKTIQIFGEAPLPGYKKIKLRLPLRERGNLGTGGNGVPRSQPTYLQSEKACAAPQVR